jgi:hypothetical protein
LEHYEVRDNPLVFLLSSIYNMECGKPTKEYYTYSSLKYSIDHKDVNKDFALTTLFFYISSMLINSSRKITKQDIIPNQKTNEVTKILGKDLNKKSPHLKLRDELLYFLNSTVNNDKFNISLNSMSFSDIKYILTAFLKYYKNEEQGFLNTIITDLSLLYFEDTFSNIFKLTLIEMINEGKGLFILGLKDKDTENYKEIINKVNTEGFAVLDTVKFDKIKNRNIIKSIVGISGLKLFVILNLIAAAIDSDSVKEIDNGEGKSKEQEATT